jgi:hypothetical protein
MKKAGDLLAALLDNLDQGAMETARNYSELVSSWKSIAGDKIAAHSRIRDLKRSVLLVEADHPGWIQILQTKQGDLLAAVRRRFPDLSIAGISFRLSRRPLLENPDDSGTGPPVRPEKNREPSNPADSSIPRSALPDAPGPPAQDSSEPRDPVEQNVPADDIADEGFKASLKRLEQLISRKTA